jgi:hypothetical protein
MGQEAVCTVRFGTRVAEGRAQLESQDLRFRGEFRLQIPFTEMQTIEAHDGVLRVVFPLGEAEFELGRLADKWASKIRHPRTVMEKLGVRRDASVLLAGVRDESFLTLLRGQASQVSDVRAPSPVDLVFFLAEQTDDLGRLKDLQQAIVRNGAVWVVFPKGSRNVRDVDVMAAAREAGLVDTKVASFSATHTALKLVIPLARR